ncbi:MAG TPA: DEAD/DEAH box helicase family protein, partial [Thiolinea sp.]|nr:DEAD/DEAH box helicase family protein [Thiolinea sp.]
MMQLRDYQRASIDATYHWFQNNPSGNPLLVLPTAAGKSVIAGKLMQEIVEQWPDQRILLLTHVKELIEQNYLKLMDMWPQAPAGIYSA